MAEISIGFSVENGLACEVDGVGAVGVFAGFFEQSPEVFGLAVEGKCAGAGGVVEGKDCLGIGAACLGSRKGPKRKGKKGICHKKAQGT